MAMLKQVGLRDAKVLKKPKKNKVLQNAWRRFTLETPLGERIERASEAGEASEASRAIRMDSVSCRVKAVQNMPSGFVKVA